MRRSAARLLTIAAVLAVAGAARGGRYEWDKPAATVNGKAITFEQLADTTLRLYGRPTLETLIRHEAVRQEAKRLGVTFTPEEFSKRLAGKVEEGMILASKRSRCKDVADFERRLKQSGREPDALRADMKRTIRPFLDAEILADKIIRATVTVSDEDVAELFRKRYGAKAYVRQIVVKEERKAKEVLEKLVKGADFAALARKESIDPVSKRRGGAVVLAAGTGVLETAAFALKPDQLSGILKTDSGFHVLKLTRIVPARDAKLETVRESLRKEFVERAMPRRTQIWLQDLMRKYEIKRNFGEPDDATLVH